MISWLKTLCLSEQPVTSFLRRLCNSYTTLPDFLLCSPHDFWGDETFLSKHECKYGSYWASCTGELDSSFSGEDGLCLSEEVCICLDPPQVNRHFKFRKGDKTNYLGWVLTAVIETGRTMIRSAMTGFTEIKVVFMTMFCSPLRLYSFAVCCLPLNSQTKIATWL